MLYQNRFEIGRYALVSVLSGAIGFTVGVLNTDVSDQSVTVGNERRIVALGQTVDGATSTLLPRDQNDPLDASPFELVKSNGELETPGDMNHRLSIVAEHSTTLEAEYSTDGNAEESLDWLTELHEVLSLKSSDDLYGSFEDVIKLLSQANVSQIDATLSELASLPTGDKRSFLINVLAESNNEALITQVLKKIDSDEPADVWLDLLVETGVPTPEARTELIGHMQNFNKAEQLASALSAMEASDATTWERDVILSEIIMYSDHPDASARASAIHALSRWAGEEELYLMESAFHDQSPDVRSAAVSSAMTSKIQSDYMKEQLIEIMNSSAEPWTLRVNAFYALDSYDLNGQDYEAHQHFDDKL